jgi:hypothetical protein
MDRQIELTYPAHFETLKSATRTNKHEFTA